MRHFHSDNVEWKAEEFEDRLFESLAETNGRVQLKKFKAVCKYELTYTRIYTVISFEI